MPFCQRQRKHSSGAVRATLILTTQPPVNFPMPTAFPIRASYSCCWAAMVFTPTAPTYAAGNNIYKRFPNAEKREHFVKSTSKFPMMMISDGVEILCNSFVANDNDSDKNVSDETAHSYRVALTSGFFSCSEFLRIGGTLRCFNTTLAFAAMRNLQSCGPDALHGHSQQEKIR